MDILRFIRAFARRTIAACKAFIRSLMGSEYAQLSYSQYGEDMILRAFFARYPGDYKGFYVDVGAHHPKNYSNTNHFYELGWRGICIDPVPGGKRLFSRQRRRDLFLETGVSEAEKEMTYYMYDQPAFNTFSEESVKNLPIPYKHTKKVSTLPLRKIFELYTPENMIIDFLTIDAEGMDLQVLMSNNWSRYRPKIVVIEDMDPVPLEKIIDLEASVYMLSNDYQVVSRTQSAVYFVDRQSPYFDGGPFLNYL